MKAWLTGIAAASVLSVIALALTPEGRVKQVTKTVCALMCSLALITPLTEIDLDKLSVSIAIYEQAGQSLADAAQEEAKMLERTYIEEKCEAYILDKGALLEADAESVSVTARWDEENRLWYPWTVAVTGPYSVALASVIEADLGIPLSRQDWSEAVG